MQTLSIILSGVRGRKPRPSYNFGVYVFGYGPLGVWSEWENGITLGSVGRAGRKSSIKV